MPFQISDVLNNNSAEAWKQIQKWLWEQFAAPLPVKGAEKEIVRRDRALAELENFLAGSAWNLWSDFADSVKNGSDGVAEFWHEKEMLGAVEGKAVLILDGLSIREIPFLLQEAETRRFCIKRSGIWAAEIPAVTTACANALGFPQRSALENNKTKSKRLQDQGPDAWTESCNMPFQDCADSLPPEQSVLFWHHWPDSKLHEHSSPGLGLEALAKEAGEKLTSDDFWKFVEHLTTGRRLLISSDHGYAATGHFNDLQDKSQAESLQAIYKGQRYIKSNEVSEPLPWIPPMDMTLSSPHGTHRLVLGRRKWKLPGGYPVLQHGGLSLLEMFVPFVEIVR